MRYEIDYVAPGPVASAFIETPKRRSLISGPFGSGKTGAAIAKILRQCFSVQKPGDGVDGPGYRYSRWAVVRNTNRQLSDTTIKSWLQWVPDGTLGHWKITERTYYIRIGDVRAEIVFRALDDDKDVRNLLSAEYTGAWLNECREINGEIANALDGRIDRYPSKHLGGATLPQLFGDTNPPEVESHWHSVMEGINPETQLPYSDPSEDPGWDVYVQPSGLSPDAENVQNLKAGRGYYEELKRGKTTNFIDMYVHGRYGRSVTNKLVHPDYDPAFHTAPSRLYPNPSLVVIVAFDFGSTPAAVMMQQTMYGQILAIDEVVTEGGGLQNMIRTKLKPILNNRYANCRVFCTGDPAGRNPSDADARTCAQIIEAENLGVFYPAANDNSMVARREALDVVLQRRTALGAGFVVDRAGCPTLSRGLRYGFQYPYNAAKKVIGATPVKNIYSHVCEAAEYGVLRIQTGVGQGTTIRTATGPHRTTPRPGAYATAGR